MSEYKWRTGRSCVFKNFIHLVFVTKYRKNVMTSKMLDHVEQKMRETCEQMDCELLEFNGESDHVHMMIDLHPKVSASVLIGKLKGKSSYFLRKDFWSQIKNKLWGDHFWSPSYCLVSCGGAPLEIMKKYIENQDRPSDEKNAKKSKALRKN